MLNLENKNIFVLGGSGLIGSEIISELIKLKANIIIIDIKKNEKYHNHKKLSYHKFDIKKNSFDKDFKKIINKYDVIDAFINCAYPYSSDWSESSFETLKYNSLKKNINYQLDNTIWTTNLVSKHMKKNKTIGSIILLNSIYGILGNDLSIYKKTNMRENIAYSVIKGGISNYVRAMCSVLSPNGIRINSICAGGVKGSVAGVSNRQSKQFIKNYSEKVPIKRLANASEIAQPVIFLCSNMSSYITGTNLVVDGGWSAI
tara:strand:- start:1168 stop:1944 length:777 start_codon:yes stop_codon:yes gene_type:complete